MQKNQNYPLVTDELREQGRLLRSERLAVRKILKREDRELRAERIPSASIADGVLSLDTITNVRCIAGHRHVSGVTTTVEALPDKRSKIWLWWELVAAIARPWQQTCMSLATSLLLATLFDWQVAALFALSSNVWIWVLGYGIHKRNVVRATREWVEMMRGTYRWRVKHQIELFRSSHSDWFLRALGYDSARFAPLASLFPNTKEVTESVAAFRILEHLPNGLHQMNIFRWHEAVKAEQDKFLVLVVGDGTTCRTGALFAAIARHSFVHSIDPAMRDSLLDEATHPAIRHLPNLRCHKSTIEEWLVEHGPTVLASSTQAKFDHVLVVAVHSHALFPNYVPQIVEALRKNRVPLTLVAIPCCVPQHFSKSELQHLGLTSVVHQQADYGILSEKRNICVWQSKA